MERIVGGSPPRPARYCSIRAVSVAIAARSQSTRPSGGTDEFFDQVCAGKQTTCLNREKKEQKALVSLYLLRWPVTETFIDR
jgi:hypothetical protein